MASSSGLTTDVNIGTLNVSGDITIAGTHTHTTDVASFPSGTQSASHTHNTDIAEFNSGSIGGY